MSAFTVAAAIAALDGADWLPPILNWEIATTDGLWGAHCEIAADTVSEAYRLLCSIASAHGSEVADDSRLLKVDFTYDDVPVRAWWLRPVRRWDVPEQCATCSTKLGEPDVSFVRLGVGSEAPVICVPCRDRMHARWVKGDSARDAEVLRGAADAINALPQDYECDPGRGDAAELLRRMADEAGKVTPTGGEITQPVAEADEPVTEYGVYVPTEGGAPGGTVMFASEDRETAADNLRRHRAVWPCHGQQLVQRTVTFGPWTTPGAEITQPAELTIYRAEHESIVMGLYTTRDAARAHCEAEERRAWMKDSNLTFAWTPDDSDPMSPEELSVFAGQNEESVTGYVVTPLTVASAYDEEADE